MKLIYFLKQFKGFYKQKSVGKDKDIPCEPKADGQCI